ncbi:MAG: 3,4-dihydroxy-2-butanone-4-phosphate synthase [Dermatophilaceae bacterium]|nr:3,4-dihydroxy-2-butanone-4-phosphate synthase [Intrasporangiaceae bacterium]
MRSTVEDALGALQEGRPVIVTDDESRENEADVILAAQNLSTEWLAWTIRHTSGYLCAPMPAEIADRLHLPLMVTDNTDPFHTAYTISVDAAEGVTTGISAADRAHTVRLLASPAAAATDFVRPGHVLPLRARPHGVLARRGHTEAAVDLCRLAGLSPVGVIAELVHDDGTMMRRPAAASLAAELELPVLTIEQLVQWRRRHDRVVRAATTSLPTAHGTFTMHGYADTETGAEHVALVALGSGSTTAPLVRVHSECLTGDAFRSLRCDCGPQLERSLARVAAEGGAVVYLRGHEGRGVGLLAKLRAYAEQDAGADTVEAQELLGLPVDAREYAAAAGILHDLGLRSVRLLTNNPDKAAGLRALGIDVVAVERLVTGATPENRTYLRTKRDRMGHDIPVDTDDRGASA